MTRRTILDTKICTKCKKELPATTEYFWKDTKVVSGLWGKCKICVKEWSNSEERKEHIKNWKKNYREIWKARDRERNRTPKRKIYTKLNHIFNVYGVTEEALVEKMNYQFGCCDICKESLVTPESKKTYAIDHNHTTGKFRGLLCENCNRAIGLFQEKIESIENAIVYLRKYNE